MVHVRDVIIRRRRPGGGGSLVREGPLMYRIISVVISAGTHPSGRAARSLQYPWHLPCIAHPGNPVSRTVASSATARRRRHGKRDAAAFYRFREVEASHAVCRPFC
jgi:hypothetical protein